MQMDVRIPIGLMFAIVGALLAVYGLISDPATNFKSLGINVNLNWGLVQLLFGLAMLFLAWRGAKKKANAVANTPADNHRGH